MQTDTIVDRFFSGLDRLSQRRPEITDTEVRTVLAYAILHGFIDAEPGYRVTHSLMCMNPITDFRLRSMLRSFIRRATKAARRDGRSTAELRFEAVSQDKRDRSSLYLGPVDTLDAMRANLSGYAPPSRWKMYTIVIEVLWDTLRPGQR